MGMNRDRYGRRDRDGGAASRESRELRKKLRAVSCPRTAQRELQADQSRLKHVRHCLGNGEFREVNVLNEAKKEKGKGAGRVEEK